MNSQDEEAEKYYPKRTLIDYYKKLIAGLEKRISDYKSRIDKLEEEQ